MKGKIEKSRLEAFGSLTFQVRKMNWFSCTYLENDLALFIIIKWNLQNSRKCRQPPQQILCSFENLKKAVSATWKPSVSSAHNNAVRISPLSILLPSKMSLCWPWKRTRSNPSRPNDTRVVSILLANTTPEYLPGNLNMFCPKQRSSTIHTPSLNIILLYRAKQIKNSSQWHLFKSDRMIWKRYAAYKTNIN